MRVTALPALTDNYVFALASDRAAVLVDPGDAAPALAWLEAERLGLDAILLTHHHRDHVGGVAELVRCHPAARVVGAAADRHRLPRLDLAVGEGDAVELPAGQARVMAVPGHTRGHLAYFVPDAGDPGGGDLFSGDTLFGGTVGNLFEGTPDEMFRSLEALRALPPASRIWCGHEYTLQYVREAARFDPDQPALAARLRRLEARPGAPTVPLRLDEERRTNPFLRWDDPVLVARFGTAPGLATFRRLCELL